MSKTTTTIALATAGGLVAVGVAGAATAAQAAPATETAGQATTAASQGKSEKKSISAQAKRAKVAAMKRQLKTLPGGEKKLPLNKYYVGAGWGHSSGPHAGRNHKGLDFAAGSGSPIMSVTDGKVAMARSYYGYGNLVIVKTPTGKRVLYAHQSKLLVKRGQTVKSGQVIGKVGSTGQSTGPHLHLEVRTDKDRAFNPAKFLDVSKGNLNQRAHQLNKLR